MVANKNELAGVRKHWKDRQNPALHIPEIDGRNLIHFHYIEPQNNAPLLQSIHHRAGTSKFLRIYV